MATANTPADSAAPLSCPTFPADLAGHTYLLDTSTCAVWDTTTGTMVRREWARSRGLPRLVFAADCRPQLGEAIKRGLRALGFTVDSDKPRWPSIHGGSGVEHGAQSFALGKLAAVPRGRPAAAKPPTYAEHLAGLNTGFAMPAFIPVQAFDGAEA